MNKQEFLTQLRDALYGLPQSEIDERVNFYSEMIEDQMEEGLSEKEAVSAVGSVDEIVTQIVADIPLAKIAKERIKSKRRLSAGEIVLLALGSPIWLSLLIAAVAVILSIYICLWAAIICLWAVFTAIIGCAVGGIISGTVFALTNHRLTSIAVFGAGLVCLGLSIFAFFVCKATTNGVFVITKRFAVWIKNRFIKKEGA